MKAFLSLTENRSRYLMKKLGLSEEQWKPLGVGSALSGWFFDDYVDVVDIPWNDQKRLDQVREYMEHFYTHVRNF